MNGIETMAAPHTNPFPGLRPFGVDEDELFFGRDDDIYELLRRLRQKYFVAVVGASGCGKSSLIRAGIISALEGGFLSDEKGGKWRCVTVRPGNAPILSLARELAPISSGGASPEELEDDGVVDVLTTLRRSSLGLVDAIQQAELPSGTRLFLLVDQFEELFTLSGNEGMRAGDEAEAFVKLLLAAVSNPAMSIYVMLTMRTDFLGRCAVFPDLADAINDSVYLLPQMTRDHLADAIREPVLACGGAISERLINRLLNDAQRQADQLPILQHALMRLWEIAPRTGSGEKALDVEQYEDPSIGTLSQALNRHATIVFDSLSSREREIAEVVFREITACEGDGQIVRRPRRLEQIARRCRAPITEVIPVVEIFREDGCSFLMPPSNVPLTGETMLDVSHEALLRQWNLVRNWAMDEAKDRKIQSRLKTAKEDWENYGRDEGYLFRGGQLEETEKWRDRHPNEIEEFSEFLLASKSAQEERKVERLVRQAEARVEAIARNKATIYICASAKDKEAAEHAEKLLSHKGFNIFGTDYAEEGAPSSVEESRAQIAACDVFIYLLTPASVATPWCKKDFEYAFTLGKRIVPVMIEPVPEDHLDSRLVRSSIIRIEKFRLRASVEMLITAIGKDYALIAEHTRLLTRAAEWNAQGRKNGYLLHGAELKRAGDWLEDAKRNPNLTLTALQWEFFKASEKLRIRRFAIVSGILGSLVLIGLVSLLLVSDAKQKISEKNAAAANYVAELERTRAAQAELHLLTSEKKHAADQARRSNEYFGGASMLLQSSQDPKKKALALHELAAALNYDANNRAAAAQACFTLLSTRGWAMPLTPLLGYSGDNTNIISAVAFAPGASADRIVGLAADGTLIIWKVDDWDNPTKQDGLILPYTSTGKPIDWSRVVSSCSFSGDARYLFVVANGADPLAPRGKLLVWTGNSYRLIPQDIPLPPGGGYRTIAWSPDDRMFTVTGISFHWDYFETWAYEISGTGCKVISGAFTTASSGKEQTVAVGFSSDGKSIATVTASNWVCWWQRGETKDTHDFFTTSTGNAVLLDVKGRINSVYCGPGKDEMTVSAWNEPLQIIDASHHAHLVAPPAPDQYMRYVFSPEGDGGRKLAAVSLPGRICIADASKVGDTNTLADNLSEPLSIRGIGGLPCFSGSGDKLLVLSGASFNSGDSVQVWDVSHFWKNPPAAPASGAIAIAATSAAPDWLAELADAVSGASRQESEYNNQQFKDYVKNIGTLPAPDLAEPYKSVWQRFFSPEPTGSSPAH